MAIELEDIFAALTADASPDGAADYVITYDASAASLKKVLLDDLPGGGGGLSGLGSTDNAVVRANGTAGTAAQGSLMTIDDSGSSSIPSGQNYSSATKRLLGYDSGGAQVNINSDGVASLYLFYGADGVNISQAGGFQTAKFDNSSTADDTRFKIWDVTAAACVRVSRGASDSGGTGFRLLRIPN